MPPSRRAHDYTLQRHAVEQLLLRVFASGWFARLHYRLGWHAPLRIWQESIQIAALGRIPPLRVVFASDFHAGPMTHPEVLSAACRTLAALKPDILLLGGDYVSWDQRFIAELAPQIGAITTRYGCFAVLGNHDLWADDLPIVHMLTQQGVQVLVNAEINLPAPYESLLIYGMDDPTAGQPRAPDALPDSKAQRLILMHSPEGLAYLQPDRYQLALAGHTHGGQIALPGGYPVALRRGSYSWRYSAGRRLVENTTRTVFVSRGIGYGDLTIRWNAPADVLVCTITGSSARLYAGTTHGSPT